MSSRYVIPHTIYTRVHIFISLRFASNDYGRNLWKRKR